MSKNPQQYHGTKYLLVTLHAFTDSLPLSQGHVRQINIKHVHTRCTLMNHTKQTHTRQSAQSLNQQTGLHSLLFKKVTIFSG